MAGHLILPPSQGAKHAYVLGLTWKRVVVSGRDPEHAARSYAHAAKASHLVLDRSPGAGEVRATGFAHLGKKAPQAVLSIALAFARQFGLQDKAVVAIRANDEAAWVCAVTDGMVVHGFDALVGIDDAYNRVQSFIDKYAEGAVIVYGDLRTDAQPMTMADLQAMARQRETDCLLVAARASASMRQPALVTLAVLVALVGGNAGWGYYKKLQRERQAALEEAGREPELSPADAWKKGLGGWVAKSDIAPSKALVDAFAAVGKLPLEVVGWHLDGATCNRKGPDWRCKAAYRRNGALRSNSADFLKAAPEAWVVEWADLDVANVSFSATTEAGKFAPENARRADELGLAALTLLQRNARAFTGVKLGAFGAVAVDMPKRADGTVYVVDPTAMKPLVVAAPIEISGPMRSTFTLLDLPISFTTFSVAVTTAASPDLTKSSLTVTGLKGDLYAIK